ncbi:MAG: HAD-IA family hydrolase [Bacteroidetes bacterium]|nr:HAD-IA family hydrolase [Bacteroidota bacterium]
MSLPNTNNKIKNIVFDLGNTLVYFDYCYFYDGVSHLEKNANARKLKKFFSDQKLDLKIGSNRIKIKDAFKILKKKFNLKIGYADFHFLYCDIFWENTQMKNFIENKLLNSGYRLYMLSNVDASHINFIDNNFPYVKHIKNRVLSYKVKAVKPDKKIYRHLINKYRLIPGETLFIDDLRQNILSSNELGLNTIHYTSHKRFLKEFKKFTGIK